MASRFRFLRDFRAIAAVAAGFWLQLSPPLAAQAPAASTQEQAALAARQFYTQVRPLLAAHCWSCHGPAKQEGGLRLDSRDAWQSGGYSKQNLLETNFEGNELLRRLQALDPHERMPLGRAPLSEEDRRIIEVWLKNGAPWPMEMPPSPMMGKLPPPPPKPWQERLWQGLQDLLDYDLRYLHPIFFTGIGFFLLILGLEWAFERAKKRGLSPAEMRGIAGMAAHLRPYAYLVPVLGLVIAGLVVHHRHTLTEVTRLQEELEEARRQAPRVPASARAAPSTTLESARPLYLRTKAPFKFGGTYYRGNDERSDQLYNGGYYRTATLQLALCNKERQELKLGDELPEDGLQIRIVIIRGRNASPTLFSRQLMARTILTLTGPDPSGGGSFPGENFLEEVRTGEEWHGYLPLPAEGPQSHVGDAYLVTGNFDGAQRFTGSAHFLVHYDLKVQDQRLAPDSELWLASTLFPGNMVWTTKNQIAASEWFDFLPIPEIEGANSTDPKLIGVPEHEKKLGLDLAQPNSQPPKQPDPQPAPSAPTTP